MLRGNERKNIFNSEADKQQFICLLYTSDAADEEDSVDLGGRRIIKKNAIIKPKVLE